MSLRTRAAPAAPTSVARKKLCVGLTGGIGSGKSTVAAMFQECGAAILDSDVISHQLTQAQGKAIPALRAAFGADYLDASGALDRARMRQHVFGDPAAKLRLEKILHPLIRAHLQVQAQQMLSAAQPYLLLVVPLLLETKSYRELVQRVLVVDCAESLQMARVMRRSGLAQDEIEAIIAQQLPRAERLREADDTLNNDGDLASLRTQVLALHRSYTSLGAGGD